MKKIKQLAAMCTLAVAATATVPAEAPPVNPEAAWRYTRLAITAGLVLLLFVVWTWQKRAGR